jgi:hypothetical protein
MPGIGLSSESGIASAVAVPLNDCEERNCRLGWDSPQGVVSRDAVEEERLSFLLFIGRSSISSTSSSTSFAFAAASYCACIKAYSPFSERKSWSAVSRGLYDGAFGRNFLLTGMPQLVDIPAPVITTTFFDFARISAISCNCGPLPDSTFTVGIFALGTVSVWLSLFPFLPYSPTLSKSRSWGGNLIRSQATNGRQICRAKYRYPEFVHSITSLFFV